MIEYIIDFLKTCPYLSDLEKIINVNYLQDTEDYYSIEEEPTERVIKEYIDGSKVKQLDIIFASRESNSGELIEQIDKSNFYENFASWIEAQSDKNNLPALPAGYEALGLEVSSNGYCFSVTEDTARYQINLKLKYKK